MGDIKKKSALASEALCQLLSPYQSKKQVENSLLALLSDDDLVGLVIELANSRFMISALYMQLGIHQLNYLLPEDLNNYLLEMYLFMQKRDVELSIFTQDIIKISNENNLTPILMKGSGALFSSVYPKKGMRFMSDLDILYQESDAVVIFHALIEKNFYVPSKYLSSPEPNYLSSDTADLPLSQHLLPLYRKNEPCALEIHLRPLHTSYSNYLDCKSAFDSSIIIDELSQKGLRANRMTPENEVVYCFVHSEISHCSHQYYYLDLRQMDFFVRLVYRYSENLDWNAIHLRIKKAGGEIIFQHYLYSINKLFNTKYPLTDAVKINMLELHYERALGSCFPKYHTSWKLRLFFIENLSLLSYEKMCKLYVIDSAFSLFKARGNYIGTLIVRYSHPRKFKNRLKYAFRMFCSRGFN